MDHLIPVSIAIDRLRQVCEPMPTQQVNVAAGYGRILREAIMARLDIPSFDRAMLDGFAVHAQDTLYATKGEPVTLPITHTAAAGDALSHACQPGFAVRTMTGAQMAPGTDAIVRLEQAEEILQDNQRYVRIFKQVEAGEAVQLQGDDSQLGQPIIASGTRIGAIAMGLLAMHGYSEVTVSQLPRVAMLATGSELAIAGQPLASGQLYDANTLMLAGLMSQENMPYAALPPCSDEPKRLVQAIEQALDRCDILVTTGGVSVGDFDWVPRTLEQLGVNRLFWGVRMRPGTPIYAGTIGKKMILALSGNPAAAYINAVVFLLPMIRQRLGMTGDSLQHRVQARLLHVPHKKRAQHTRFLRGHLLVIQNELWIDLSAQQSAGTLSSFVGMSSLAQIDPEAELTDGTLVPVHLTGERC